MYVILERASILKAKLSAVTNKENILSYFQLTSTS